MQDNILVRRSSRRRRARRGRHLLIGLIFIVGAVVGWMLLGWSLLPVGYHADPADLNASAKAEYVSLTVESWSVTHDLAQARERLRGFDHQELAAIINTLIASRNREEQPLQVEQLTAFAVSYGVQLPDTRAAFEAAATSQPPTPTPVPTLTAVPTPLPFAPHLRVTDDISGTFRAAIVNWAMARNFVQDAAGADADVVVSPNAPAGAVLLAERIYVVVDRFAMLRTGISQSDLRALWRGQPLRDGTNRLLVTDDDAAALAPLLGQSGPTVRHSSLQGIIQRLWSEPGQLAIVPFDELTPRLSALTLDGVNVLAHDFQIAQYPLVARWYVSGKANLAQALVDGVRAQIPIRNREPERITTLIMTGVTAIARTSALKIDQHHDPAYPARVIAPVLAAADITHVSNEVPFTDDCQAVLGSLVLCSKPSYLATLKLAGVKIIGLTGNHLVDYGAPAFLKTLDLFEAQGFKYYGGGRNSSQARETLFVEDHGNRLAFLGANSFGPRSDWATVANPGARQYDAAEMKQDIAAARKQADVIFVELQAEETYDYAPSGNNQLEFRATLGAGADVVTGVQAHHPQSIEFSSDGRHLILYGLGNLFFDQMFDDGVRQGLVVRHTIHEGRLIQTELLTTMLEDYAQPRWATPSERATILNAVLAASSFTASNLK